MKLLIFVACCISVFGTTAGTTGAQETWTGPSVVFTKANDADWNLPENQDRITDDVWITRKSTRAIFNIKVESEYNKTDNDSPLGTEWAAGDIADWATLTYQPFFEYAGGRVGDNVLTLGPSVVHLIADDIYIPIKFTSWTASAGGGGFSYTRGTRDPSPVASSTWGAIKALYE